MGDAKPTEGEAKAARRRRLGDRIPGPIAWTVLFLCALIAILANVTGIRGDRGEVNVAIIFSAAVAMLTLVLWFVFRSTYPTRVRYGFLIALFLVIVALAANFRVDQVSGEMVPEFSFRWRPRPDQQLERIGAKAGAVDLATTTPLDFPQYLGPERTGKVDTVELSNDWSKRKPKLIWRQRIGAGWSAFSAVNGFAVTMEQRGNEELVTCYEVHTGNVRWANGIHARHETVLGGIGPRSTPTIHDGKVYALGATGVLRCLDGADGKLIWQRDLLKEFNVPPNGDSRNVSWGRSNSPLVVDDLVVVPAGGQGEIARSLIAYHRENGERVWAAGNWQVSYSSPIVGTINNVRQIVSVNEDAVSGHRIQDGQVLWNFEWKGSSTQKANTSQPLIFENSVIATKGYARGMVRCEIEGSTVKELYRNPRVLRTKLTSAVLNGHYAYGLSDGIMECVDVRDGSRAWKGGRYGHGQILMVNDLILVLSETGELALVAASPDDHRQFGKIQAIEGKTWNNLCLFGRFLLIRNSEVAACYELPLQTQ